MWALSSTFAKYYGLILMAKARSNFGRRDWLALRTGEQEPAHCRGSYPHKEESTYTLIFPQAVVHVILVTALPEGVFVYSVISEHMNTTSFDSYSVLCAQWVGLSGRAVLGTIFPSYLTLVGWMGFLSSLSS